ncbi:hypothetical protein C8N32_10685 [Rhodovulum imhoffii]|uniref:Uncharacterized protein n=1 Tax=Rhodovulum imhoffii TaxID=365340 RepID=A0A2T5BSZ0_9RHOB|nr:hypothetical protein C8N32_10685 [Rhodovulum imhoffii]
MVARLATLLFSLILPTLMGVGILGFLMAGFGTPGPIVAAAVGLILSLPLSWAVARTLY